MIFHLNRGLIESFVVSIPTFITIQRWAAMANTTYSIDKQTTSPSVSSGLWADILNRISQISQGLSGIGSQTEKDFIALGRSLMEGDSAGRAIEAKAIEIVSVTEGEQETKALSSMKEHIDTSLSQFRANKENIENQFVSVKNVLAHLTELQNKNDDIDRLARYLRAVALNIFIETSRSNVVSDNFSIIAKEIKQLSENIVELSKTVNITVDDAKKRFSTLYTSAHRGVTELDQVSTDTDQTVQQAVTITDCWLDLAGKTAANAVSMGQALSAHVGNIVMALQFHDAMRQRLEHIVTGLSDITSLCKKNAGHEPDSEALSTAHAMASLLSDHMEHMIVEIGDVHAQCSQAFDAIERGIETIAEEVTGLTGRSGKGVDRLGDDAGRHLLSSLQSLGSLRSRGMTLVERMNDIYVMSAQTTSTLKDLTGKIHNISMDAHIKGINAIIAASHLGDEGRTLTVLAGEMKKLADLVDLFVRDVGTIINQVASDMDVPRETGETRDEQDKNLDDILTSIISMVNTMKNQAGDLHNNMETIDDIHKRVKSELQIIPSMGQDLGVQKKNLGNLLNLLAPFADGRGKDRLADSGMIGRYTMEKERLIHQSSVSENREPEKNHATNFGVSQDLGDNVELF